MKKTQRVAVDPETMKLIREIQQQSKAVRKLQHAEIIQMLVEVATIKKRDSKFASFSLGEFLSISKYAMEEKKTRRD